MAKPLPAHFPLAPSSAWRGLNCPGSWRLTDDHTNRKADAGTVVHAIIPVWVNGGYDALSLEAAVYGATAPLLENAVIATEIASAAVTYYEHVSQHPGQFEVKLQHPTIPDFGGTIDCLRVAEEARIDDFKSGTWPTHLEQLQCYSLLAMRAFPTIQSVACTIVQPRARDGNTKQEQTWTRKELVAFERRVRKAANSDTINPGEWCMWCPARPTCAVAQEAGAPNKIGRYRT